MNIANYTEINSKTIDRWIEKGWEWGIPISSEEYIKAKNGEWNVLLTPTKNVPKNWFPELKGKKILGLASGGGQQMPIFTALGGICIVLDYSDRQLESERIVAEREKYDIEIIKADMTKTFPFNNNAFDIIFHPVSNCYIENIYPIWNECFRVLNRGGILLAGFDNGLNFLFDDDSREPLILKNRLPYNPLKNKEQLKKLEENDGIQFSHSMEEQIGGQLKAGFILKDIYEDYNNYGLLRTYNIPTFLATLAMKI